MLRPVRGFTEWLRPTEHNIVCPYLQLHGAAPEPDEVEPVPEEQDHWVGDDGEELEADAV